MHTSGQTRLSLASCASRSLAVTPVAGSCHMPIKLLPEPQPSFATHGQRRVCVSRPRGRSKADGQMRRVPRPGMAGGFCRLLAQHTAYAGQGHCHAPSAPGPLMLVTSALMQIKTPTVGGRGPPMLPSSACTQGKAAAMRLRRWRHWTTHADAAQYSAYTGHNSCHAPL